jgi:IS5 family transposase
MSFNQFILREQYQKVKGLGDRLELMKHQIDWEPFRPLVAKVFYDNDTVGGRPHTDELLVVRTLLLQGWYTLSDEELEFQCNDRLSFRNFLGFPEKVPDFSTIWKIRDRLKEAGVESQIWDELQRQLDVKGCKITKGVIQDATFIEAEQGRKRRALEKQAKKEGREITYTEKQKAHMDKDGTYAVKNERVYFGYKLHTKVDVDNNLIRECVTTTASQHDATINLVEQNDIAAYRDKGYFGIPLPENVVDKTMWRGVRGRKLNGGEQRRNKAISRIRSPGERQFAVIKEVFHGGIVTVTTLARVHIKQVFTCFAYNLYQLVTIQRRQLARALQN